MPVAVASNTESPPGDPVCKARQVPVQGDVGNMVPPIDIEDSPEHSGVSAIKRLPR